MLATESESTEPYGTQYLPALRCHTVPLAPWESWRDDINHI